MFPYQSKNFHFKYSILFLNKMIKKYTSLDMEVLSIN